MLFVVMFEDEPSRAEIRPRLMPDHLAFLEREAKRIRAAGPLLREDGSGAGGLWLVDADSPAEARTLIEADPFWPTGLRRSVRILHWRQVFADGRRI
ncbi:MAG: YciI family protein [Rhodospirillaceae bacterium]|nr:YciI family protein [Rhodospirillaceae bacterium]